MSSGYTFTALYGSESEGPVCSLLEINSVKILLDCGWDEKFDLSTIQTLSDHASSINAILLSHSDMEHCGALLYLYSSWNCNADIYLSTPGEICLRAFLEDITEYRSTENLVNRESSDDLGQLFSPDNLKQIYSHLRPMSFGQRLYIASTIYVVPHFTENRFDGSVWEICFDSERVIYEMYVDPLANLSLTSSNVSLLITDCTQRSNKQVSNVESLLAMMLDQVIRDKGVALLPVDSSSRVIQLLWMIKRIFDKNKWEIGTFFLSNTSKSFIEKVTSFSDHFTRSAHKMSSQLNFSNIICTSDIEEVLDASSPKIVLATLPGLEGSFAMKMLIKIARQQNNLLLFTSPPPPSSLAEVIFSDPITQQFRFINRVRRRLTDEERDEFIHEQQRLRDIRRKEAEKLLQRTPSDQEEEDEWDEWGEPKNPSHSGLVYAVFADHDDDVEVDEFGTRIPFFSGNQQMNKANVNSNSLAEDMALDDAKNDSEKADKQRIMEVKEDKLTLSLHREMIDCDQRTDKQGAEYHVKKEIRPAQIICFHGKPENIKSLASLLGARIASDTESQAIDYVYHVKKAFISHELLDPGKFEILSEKQQLGVRVVRGQLRDTPEDWVLEAQRAKSSVNEVTLYEDSASQMIHEPVLVRSTPLTLQDVYEILSKNGIVCQGFGGVYKLFDGQVIIKKEENQIVVEGIFSPELKRVQNLLLSQYKAIF